MVNEKNNKDKAKGTVEPRRAQAESGQGLEVERIYKVIVCREEVQ